MVGEQELNSDSLNVRARDAEIKGKGQVISIEEVLNRLRNLLSEKKPLSILELV